MFGFLLAMIKTTYDKNNLNRLSIMYTQRCEMNLFSYNIYKNYPFADIYENDLLVVSSNFKEPKESEVDKLLKEHKIMK